MQVDLRALWDDLLSQTQAQSLSFVKMLLFFISFTINLVANRLVLESWDDLYQDDGSVDMERLTREADPLSVTTEPYQECPEVDVKVTLYEVFLLEDGVEVSYSIQSYQIIDIENVTGTHQNKAQPWIKASLTLRSVELSFIV